MTRDELIEALGTLPFDKLTFLYEKQFKPLTVKSLPSLPKKFTTEGLGSVAYLVDDWEKVGKFPSTYLAKNATVVPVDNDTILLEKDILVGSQYVQSIVKDSDGNILITLNIGESLL